MKRLLAILVALSAVVLVASAKAPQSRALINFTRTTCDVGSIAEDGGPVKCEYEFTNTGDSPLVIISATASCGCTQPTFPKEPIQPGKQGVIKVTFHPEGHPGEIDKDVKVRTNAFGTKRVNLKLRGTVVPAKRK